MRMALSEALRDDLVALETGVFCLLPRLDASGRQVLYLDPSRHTREGYTSDSLVSIECNTSLCRSSRPLSHVAMEQLRAIWYVIEVTSLANDEIRSGFVQLVWFKNTNIFDYDAKVYDQMNYLERSAWPIRRCCCHVCCPDSYTLRILKPIVFATKDKEARARTLIHTVPMSKILSVLSDYGIERDMLPTDMGGSLKFDQYLWIENRRAVELEEI